MTKKKLNYTRIGIFSAIAFLIVVFLIEFLFSLNTKKNTEAILSEMSSIKFIASKVIMAILYGLFMVYLVKKKERKLER